MVVCAQQASVAGADRTIAKLWADEIVCQRRRSARRVWNNAVFVPNRQVTSTISNERRYRLTHQSQHEMRERILP